jgi:hypothetical protein
METLTVDPPTYGALDREMYDTQGQIGGISRLSAGSSAPAQLRTDAGIAHATAAHAHVDWAGRTAERYWRR